MKDSVEVLNATCLGLKDEASHDLDPNNQWACRRCGGWSAAIYADKLRDHPQRGLFAPYAFKLDGSWQDGWEP